MITKLQKHTVNLMALTPMLSYVLVDIYYSKVLGTGFENPHWLWTGMIACWFAITYSQSVSNMSSKLAKTFVFSILLNLTILPLDSWVLPINIIIKDIALLLLFIVSCVAFYKQSQLEKSTNKTV